MRHHPLLKLGATALLALAACSEGPTDLSRIESPLLSADVARVAAEGVGEDLDLMRDPTLGFFFGLPPIGLSGPRTDNCSFDGEWYSCGPVDRGSLSFFRQIAFYDASGTPMAEYDGNLTASIRMRTTVEGEAGHDAWSASVSRERDFTVSGLQGQEQTRTWNGTGHGEISRSRHTDEGTARTYNMEETTTVVDVVVPHFNNDQMSPWPLSGTITRVVSIQILDGEGSVLREATRTVVVTFDGSQFATMTVTGPHGPETFSVDLAERRPHRHRP